MTSKFTRVDNFDEQGRSFLKGLGVYVGPEVVREIAERVLKNEPLYPLHKIDGPRYRAGKGTVYKIKGLIEGGKLDPILRYWGLIEATGETEKPEEDAMQLAHLRALLAFVKDERLIETFFVKRPVAVMELMLSAIWENHLRGTRHVVALTVAFSWEMLPIRSWLRDHIPEHSVWQRMREFKTREWEYRSSIADMVVALRAEFEDALGFPATDIMGPSEEQRLLLDIFAWLTGMLLGKLDHYHRTAASLGTQGNAGAHEASFGLYWGGTCYGQGTGEQIECARAAVDRMLERWLKSQDVRSVVYRFQELENLVKAIVADIDQIDEAVLAQGTCPECPKLKSKQGGKKLEL